MSGFKMIEKELPRGRFSEFAESVVSEEAIRWGGEEAWVEGEKRHVDHVERLGWICEGLRDATGVLDIGSAHGFFSRVVLERLGIRRYLGIEITRAWSYFATTRYGPHFIRGDAASLPVRPGVFDVVLLGEILEHVLDPAAVLAEARRVVSGDGKAIITWPSRPGSTDEPDHLRYMDKDCMFMMVNFAGFRVDEGSYHSNGHFQFLMTKRI